MLIEIDDKIVTDELFTSKFVCDLESCKGACCIEGDDGAPLLKDEVGIIEGLLPKVKPYMTEEGIAVVEKNGVSHIDDEGGPVTNLVADGACVFVTYDERGIAKCAIEKAYRNGDTDWKKPVSCELFPIRATQYNSFTALNYEKIDICDPGCTLGEKLSVPLYKFLKEPLIRSFGTEFFKSLEEVAEEIKNQDLGKD